MVFTFGGIGPGHGGVFGNNPMQGQLVTSLTALDDPGRTWRPLPKEVVQAIWSSRQAPSTRAPSTVAAGDELPMNFHETDVL
jgi:hypothetical protein